MIGFEQALSLIASEAKVKDTEIIETLSASGCVLAEPIYAPSPIPQFNNTAMDGYAVIANDLINASKETPVKLRQIGVTAAGEVSDSISSPVGTALKIMTGATVPEAYDAIIPVEATESKDDTVFCYSPAKKGDHIRKVGEDFDKGELILSQGEVISSNTIAALTALGVSHVKVYKPITISTISTGKELVDDFKTSLAPGQIRNSNKPFILDWLKDYPVAVKDLGTNLDDAKKFEADLKKELSEGTDIIISTGAVSMGDFDFIPKLVKKLGGEIIFHKVKIRPGKPILFAKFANGSYYFGLPGNPISTIIGLRFFVTHLMLNLLSKKAERPTKSCSKNFKEKRSDFRFFWKAAAEISADAQHQTAILDGQESFKIKPLLNSNGWAVVKENVSSIEQGDLIDFYTSKLPWS